MSTLEPAQLLIFGGLVLGLLFGSFAQATAFCSSGAILDVVRKSNSNRLRAWGVALAVAVLASQLLFVFGGVDLTKSIYLATPLNLAGPIAGGFVFGVGMMLGNGCVSRNLVRLGYGNIRSFVVVVLVGITAYMTLRGIVAPLRLASESATRTDLGATAIPDILASRLPLDAATLRWIIAIALAAALLFVCFASKSFRASPRNIIGGLSIGLLIAAAWYFTGVLAQDEFNPLPPASLSFVAPVGDAVEYLMIFTGTNANFGIAVVGGVIVGAFVTSVIRGKFAIEGFSNANDFFRQIIGAMMMGVGGVFAMGCTIGQGLTGMSTLSLGSALAAISIFAGGFVGASLLNRLENWQPQTRSTVEPAAFATAARSSQTAL
jgi:uncharacterized membrane protein YedE/YeeE